MKNNLTIHKQNSIIQGRFEVMDLYTMRCLNTLYYIVQRNKEELITNNTIEIDQYDIREYMGLLNISNYSKIIYTSLTQLKETFYPYKYRDADGIVQEDHPIEVITGFRRLETYSYTYSITIHQDFIDMVNLDKNWTELRFNNIMKFSSKYSLRLYEYLSSIKRQGFKEKLTLERLNMILLTKHQHLSKIEDIIKRCIKDFEGSDLVNVTYVKDKRRRTILFSFKFMNNLEKKKKEDSKQLQSSIELEYTIDDIVQSISK